jgi:hypothetical protein
MLGIPSILWSLKRSADRAGFRNNSRGILSYDCLESPKAVASDRGELGNSGEVRSSRRFVGASDLTVEDDAGRGNAGKGSDGISSGCPGKTAALIGVCEELEGSILRIGELNSS